MVHLHSGPLVLCPDCLLPSPPYGATGTGPFRREPSNSTGGTLTHERNHLHGLLRRIRTLPRSAAVSQISRGSFATSGCWNTPDASGYFDVLRLVEDDTAALRIFQTGSWRLSLFASLR